MIDEIIAQITENTERSKIYANLLKCENEKNNEQCFESQRITKMSLRTYSFDITTPSDVIGVPAEILCQNLSNHRTRTPTRKMLK